MRLALLISIFLLSGCADRSSDSSQTDLCGMSRRLGGWRGADVRLQGYIIGASPHGIRLMADRCFRGVALTGAEIYRRADIFGGIRRADLTGRIEIREERIEDKFWPRPTLRVTQIHAFRIIPLSADEEKRFMIAQGFR